MIEVKDITNANKQLYIVIEPAGAEAIELFGSDIQNSNSVSINNKAVSGSDFEFGAVFSGECTFTFKSGMDRYKLYDAKVTVQVGNGTDTVDKGVFYITDAVRSGSYISVTAYDGMLFLDAEITESTIGDVYALLSYTAEKCGIELAQTQEEIEALPNALHAYDCRSDVVGTYRDLVYYLAKITCTFATFDGTGKLKLCRYHLENDLVIDKNGRSRQEISDYEVYYEAVMARFVLKDVYELYSAESSDNVFRWYDFGNIPIVSSSNTVHKEIINNMLTEALKIRYVPASVNIKFNPFIELGDKIELLNTNNKGDTVDSYVMSYEWSFRGSTKIKSVGSNPYLSSAQTKEEKQIKSMEKSLTTRNMILHSYTNASEIILGSDEKDIISINYSAVETAQPIFLATIPFVMDLDGYVVFRYYLDGVLMESDTVRQYVARGEHFATISNNLIIKKNARNTLKVTACTEYFESDNRQQVAKILSFEKYISTGKYVEQAVDTTIPEATIAKSSIRAVLYAQGLAGTDVWDGTITIVDEIAAVVLSNDITVAKMAGSVAISQQVPTSAVFADVFAPVQLNNMITVSNLYEEVTTGAPIIHYTFNTEKAGIYDYDSDYVTVEGAFRVVEGSEPQNIVSNAIALTDATITGIESIKATCEGVLCMAVSFDGKATWKAWNGEQWATLSEEFSGMNQETVESITFEQWNLLYIGASEFYIRITLSDITQSVTELYVDFAN